MTTKRTYGTRLTHVQACHELQEQAGTQFDPRVVAALLEALEKQALAGSTGLLAPAEVRGVPGLPA